MENSNVTVSASKFTNCIIFRFRDGSPGMVVSRNSITAAHLYLGVQADGQWTDIGWNRETFIIACNLIFGDGDQVFADELRSSSK